MAGKATLRGPRRATGKLQSLGGSDQPHEGRHIKAPNNTVTIHVHVYFRIVVSVHGYTIPIECLVDTGAALSLLHGDVWTKIATSPQLQEWIGQALAQVNGNKMSVRGYIRIPVSLKSQQFDVKSIVTDDIIVDAILGLDFVQENYCIDCGRRLFTFPLLGNFLCHFTTVPDIIVPGPLD